MPNGPIVADVTVTPVFRDDECTFIVHVSSDITERRKAEEALRKSERKFRELTDLLPQTVFETDMHGNFTFTNRAGFQAFGYTPEDLQNGLNALQMFIPEDRDRARENIAKSLRGESRDSNEYTALRKDGATFPVIIHSTPIIRDGTPVGLRGLVIDITKRKRAEEALRESEERYRAIFEQAADSILLVDAQTGAFADFNDSACRNLGYTREEFKFDKERLLDNWDKYMSGEKGKAYIRNFWSHPSAKDYRAHDGQAVFKGASSGKEVSK